MLNQFRAKAFRQKNHLSAIKIILAVNFLFFTPWLIAYITGNQKLLSLSYGYGALNVGFPASIPSMDSSFLYVYQLLTSVFLHGGMPHLIFNMYALYAFGTPLEQRWGSVRFVFFYLAVGVLANLASYLCFRFMGANVSLIGASGAIYGVLLAFGSYYPESKVLLFFFIPLKIKWLVPVFTVIELLIEISGRNDGIAHLTHLFGFLFAFFYLLFVFKNNAIKRMYFPDKEEIFF